MSSDTLFSIAKFLLPEVLVRYFDLTNHEIKEEEIHFYFTELNEVPEEFKDIKLHSKGFFQKLQFKTFRFVRKKFFFT